MTDGPRTVACDDWWPEPVFTGGSAHYVSSECSADPPVILVPDTERGGYREHEVLKRPKGRMGFR